MTGLVMWYQGRRGIVTGLGDMAGRVIQHQGMGGSMTSPPLYYQGWEGRIGGVPACAVQWCVHSMFPAKSQDKKLKLKMKHGERIKMHHIRMGKTANIDHIAQ